MSMVLDVPDEQVRRSATRIPNRPSLKRNFGWALAGNLIYQGSQWLNLVLLAKLLPVSQVGLFALALAVCTPISTFAALMLRSVQVTENGEQYRFGHFLALQMALSLAAVLAISAVAGFSGYEPRTAVLIVIIGIGQAVVLIRDVYLAYAQKQERMDTVARSNAIAGLLSLAALGVATAMTRSLLIGVAGLQIAKLIVFLIWDIPVIRRLFRANERDAEAELRPLWDPTRLISLAWMALPLGVASVVISLYWNLPRYAIERSLGTEQLGYFAAITALVMAGKQVTQAAAQSALPRLSRYYVENRRAYISLLARLVAVGAILGLAGLIVVVMGGKAILAIVFTPEYAHYEDLFIWIMLMGAIVYINNFLQVGMIAMRRFRIQPLAYTVGLATISLILPGLISTHGLVGAGFSLIIGYIAVSAISIIVLTIGLMSNADNRQTGALERA